MIQIRFNSFASSDGVIFRARIYIQTGCRQDTNQTFVQPASGTVKIVGLGRCLVQLTVAEECRLVGIAFHEIKNVLFTERTIFLISKEPTVSGVFDFEE